MIKLINKEEMQYMDKKQTSLKKVPGQNVSQISKAKSLKER